MAVNFGFYNGGNRKYCDCAIMNEFDALFSLSGLSLDRLRSFLMVAEAGNLANAAKGEVTRQSQFSRQIKELEAFFGVALTRRVGRRIEITDEGRRLALVIRRQFRELDDFREAMNGRPVGVRIGSQGSVIDWLVVPRLGLVREALGPAVVELEQLRTREVVRAVTDGRLDFGIVRADAVPAETKGRPLGQVGYAVFGASPLWQGCASAKELLDKAPVAELLPGGQFIDRWQHWLAMEKVRPQVVARVPSFTDLARVVQAGHAVAALPAMAAADFDPKQFKHANIAALKPRQLVMIANPRSLDRAGIAPGVEARLAGVLECGGKGSTP
jgi:DNA-binding transcriptional LysR family regulator